MRRLLLVVFLAGCHEHDHGTEGPQADEYFYDCETAPAGVTIYATDEAFARIVEKEAAAPFTADDTQAPLLTAPMADATISGTTPPEFSFRATKMASAPSRAGRAHPAPVRRTWWSKVRDWASPIGTAWAHCPAVNGDIFLFRLTKDGDAAALYTAELSVTKFTPTAAAWQKALGGLAGQKVRLTLARAVFSKGSITNGPFVSSTPLRFTVGP